MNKRLRTWLLMVASLLCMALTAATAQASVLFVDGGPNPVPVIWLQRYYTAAQTVTLTVNNASWWSDPVMTVVREAFGANPPVHVIGDDDSAGFYDPTVTFVAPTTGNYRILVHGKTNGGWGNGDLWENGVKLLNQAPFGGTITNHTWAGSESFRVTGHKRGATNDFILFLKTQTIRYSQHDDNGGPNSVYPYLVSAGSISGSLNPQVLFGLKPGATGNGYLTKDDQSISDSDEDGVGTALEQATGTSDSDLDSDNDGIPDGVELLGNTGIYSFSEALELHNGSPWVPNSAKRNVHVEFDYMSGRMPYANLPVEVAFVFTFYGTSRADVVIGTSLTSSTHIGLDGCGSVANCASFLTLKSANFSPGASGSLRRAWSHYAISANQVLNSLGAVSCVSGLGEEPGNDFVVALGSACGWASTNDQMFGTFMHEFGHNLWLSHWGNEQNTLTQNSTIHNSVMNYRYQTAGVTGQSGTSRFQYSPGVNACAACSSSPKLTCATARAAGTCGSNANCDCDRNEWGSAINYDITSYGGSLSDGATASEFVNRDPADRIGPYSNGKEIVRRPDSRKLPLATLAELQAKAARKIAVMNERGLVKGVDYVVSSDGLRTYPIESEMN